MQAKLVPVVIKLKNTYGLWQKYLVDFPNSSKYTLGSKIDDVFINAIEFTFLASYANVKEKLPIIDRSISRVDLVKLLLLLAWETKNISTNKYAELSISLDDIGKMLGGWRKQVEQKTSETPQKKNY